ncbi:DUF4442 domain-containing protein [Neotamlana sedimentorum]|nr:DUF4442 domain-containing protein [Tamlana sedimentorum]
MLKVLQKIFKSNTILKTGFNLNIPYRRSSGRVCFVSDDLQTIKIKIPLTYKNKNYIGTMFGGSMFAATDPIYMMQLITILGNNYVVWDKAGSIQFKRPVTKTVFANFIITNEFLKQIENDINKYNEKDYCLKVNLTDKDGVTYAEVERVIYIASKFYYKNKKH